MDIGSFTTGLLTGLREGVEGALIVSIILAYLARTGNRRHFPRIWLGAAAALALSVAVGALLFVTIGELRSPYAQIFEGTAMLLAAGVVTWMLFWMRRTAANARGELQAGIDRRLSEGRVWGLSVLAFTAFIREGIETALFLLGQATAASRADAGAASVLVGALVGMVIAGALGVAFYRGARIINLGTFFRWTGIALVFIAAGLLSHALHEFADVRAVTFGTATAFDLSGVLPDAGSSPAAIVGQFLRALFGYAAAPEWITLLAWLTYVLVILTLYLRPVSPAPPRGRRSARKAYP